MALPKTHAWRILAGAPLEQRRREYERILEEVRKGETGAAKAPILAPTSAQVQRCVDTPGWTDGNTRCQSQHGDDCTSTGWTCAGYVKEGWCENGTVTPKSEWTLGAVYNSPERNCCACGYGQSLTS